MRRCLLGVCVWALSAAAEASAQELVGPGAHFGALPFPANEPGADLGLHFDRFTEFGKPSDPNGTVSYNGLHETVGLNLVGLTVTRPFPGARATLYHLAAHGGFSGDEPTRYFQNEFLHQVAGWERVIVGKVQRKAHAGLSAGLDRWFRLPMRAVTGFVGGGGQLSTIHQDAFVHAGMRTPRFGLSAMLRAGVIGGGTGFPGRVLNHEYLMGTVALRLPLDDWADPLPLGGLIPEVEVGVTRSSGLFRSTTGRRRYETVCALRATWTPFTFELWNDVCGGKDQGPSYGARLSLHSPGFRWLEKL